MRKDVRGKLLADRSKAKSMRGNLKKLLSRHPDNFTYEDFENIDDIFDAFIDRINNKLMALDAQPGEGE